MHTSNNERVKEETELLGIKQEERKEDDEEPRPKSSVSERDGLSG